MDSKSSSDITEWIHNVNAADLLCSWCSQPMPSKQRQATFSSSRSLSPPVIPCPYEGAGDLRQAAFSLSRSPSPAVAPCSTNDSEYQRQVTFSSSRSPSPPVSPCPIDGTEDLRLAKRQRIMNTDPGQQHRAPKRHRNSSAALLSPIESAQSTTASEMSETRSNKSGRQSLSDFNQLQVLEEWQGHAVVFCNFDDTYYTEEPGDVAAMRSVIQQFADGIGILGYDDVATVASEMTQEDKVRLQYSWANDPTSRCALGSMPPMSQVQEIVESAQKYDRGVGASEDEWNSGVHKVLLDLALKTSKHKETLTIQSVKSAKIDILWHIDETGKLPRRIVDYVIALKGDSDTKRIIRSSTPHPKETPVRSWNQNTLTRDDPYAISIETKSSSQSWTDGKPQVAIWTAAQLKRLAYIGNGKRTEWPALPILIVQGHDWHFLVLSKNGDKSIIREKITFGSTRSCYDAMKVLAALHWFFDWAERVWRPWIKSLDSGSAA